MFKPKPDEKLVPLTVNLSEEELEKITRLADLHGCKRPRLIRQLVQYFIEQETNDRSAS